MTTDQKLDLIITRLDSIEKTLAEHTATLAEHTATLAEHGHDIKAILSWIPHSAENVKTMSRLQKPAMAAKGKS